MLIIDFSQAEFNLHTIQPTTDFEQSVVGFLANWLDDSIVMQVQTSGSTGAPKQIELTKENMRKSARMTCKYLQLTKGDTALLAMPVSYIAGKLMLVRAIEIGLKLICVQPTSSLKWEDFNAQFNSIDFVALTPMQVEHSLNFVSHCNKLIIGGAPLSNKVKQELSSMTNEVYETYAMTETITHIAFKQVPNQKHHSSNLFEAFEEVNIKQDERGCLVIETPYDDLNITTNDIVELVDERRFNWIGRADNVINSGGIKLFPEQIEEQLKPYIHTDFFITSKSDQTLGQKLVLIIEGTPLAIDINKANLSRYQIPKEIIFINQFPRTESGKIQRNKIIF